MGSETPSLIIFSVLLSAFLPLGQKSVNVIETTKTKTQAVSLRYNSESHHCFCVTECVCVRVCVGMCNKRVR